MINSTNGMIKGDMKDMHMYMMKDLAGDVEWDQEEIKILREEEDVEDGEIKNKNNSQKKRRLSDSFLD
tara:strand:- start:2770 stop:2973 length:204 start_codon:yes stop_codon:yes gene_type:complete